MDLGGENHSSLRTTPHPRSFLFHFALQLSVLKKKEIPTRRAQETGKIVVLLVSCLEKNRVLTISVALGVKVGFVAGDTAPIQGRLSQLLRAGLCFDRRAECNADSCFNFQPDADITHTEPETQERKAGPWAAVGLRPQRVGWRGLVEAPQGCGVTEVLEG